MEDQKTSAIVSVVPEKNKNKLLIIIAIFIILVVLVVLGVLLFRNKKTTTTSVAAKASTSTTACSDTSSTKLLTQAVSDFSTAKVSQLKGVVDTIEALPGYRNDPNCLYPVIMYNYYASNSSQAQTNMNQFNKVYKGQLLNPVLTNFGSVESLQQKVAGLVLRTNDLLQNAKNISSQSPKEIKKS